MNTEKILTDIQKELPKIPKDQQLTYIKARLMAIEDHKERKLVEDLFLITQSIKILIQPVVVLVHGIRTHALWHQLLSNELTLQGNKNIYSITYGYFDLIRFWIPLPYIFRISPINHTTRELRQIISKHQTDDIVVVAHSFGTYIISKILNNHTDLKLSRLLLCGSIIKENFRWDKLPNFPLDKVINDCGTLDYLPLLAKSSTFGYGASGTFGFNSHMVNNRYHDAGHSDFFTRELMNKFWIPFINEGKLISSEWDTKRSSPPWVASIFSLFPGQLFFTVVGLIFLVKFLFF